MTTARNRAIDRIRRDRTLARKTELLARLEELRVEETDESTVPDEQQCTADMTEIAQGLRDLRQLLPNGS